MAFILDPITRKIVDHDRKAELISIQGYSSGHKTWEIKWKEDSFRFDAKDTNIYGGENGKTPISVEWFIASMDIPEKLADRRLEIIAMIKESLEVMGAMKGLPRKVYVKFDPRLVRSIH